MQDESIKISLKSNRNFLIKAFLPLWIIFVLLVIASSIVWAVDRDQEAWLDVLIIIGSFTVALTVALLIIKFYRGKWYEFCEEEIVCYKRNKEIDRIAVSDIMQISYYKFKLKYVLNLWTLLCILFGEAPDCAGEGFWKIHIALRGREFKELGYLSFKDIKMLKEKLYGNLVSISPAM